MKSTIRIVMAFVTAGAAFGNFADVVEMNIPRSEIRMCDGGGPVYPPGSFRVGTPFGESRDGSGPVYPPGVVKRLPGDARKDGGGPVYPPGRVS